RGSFIRQKLMRTIGAELTRLMPGEAEISLPYRDDLTQQHGFVHAGIIATIADTACGYVAFSLMPTDAAVLTVEYKINLMAPAVGELFVAQGRVIRPGKTLSVCSAEVMAHHRGKVKTVATMLATMMTLANQEGLSG
ncbi:MAG TPA: PaaI family thioesterase, partial [Desulfobaccales bacterium]